MSDHGRGRLAHWLAAGHRATGSAALPIFFALVLTAAFGCGAPATSERANLLLITLDTVRADHLGGASKRTGRRSISPNLDRLAAEGVRFDMAISTAAVTPVSHASILTGLNPYGHGVRVLSADSGFRLSPEIPSLTTRLGAAGYRTGAVHSSFTVSGYFGFDHGFDAFESFESELSEAGEFEDWDMEASQRRADATTDLATEFLDGEKRPFFLWVHYWDMHDAALLPDEAFMPPSEKLLVDSEGVVQQNAALYAAEIRYMDHHLGRLLAALDERGLASETVVAVVSDHGEGLGDHGWPVHRLLYQEQIHVPLILRIPGVAPDTRVGALVRTIDLFPTLLDYLGVEAPDEMHGTSLRSLIEGKAEAPRLAYSDQINLFDKNAMMVKARPNDVLLHSVQDQRWKLIYKPLHPFQSELYDMAADPREARNLFRVDHAEVRRLLADLARRDGWVLEAPRGEGMDPEARARLEVLGYLDTGDATDVARIAWAYTPPARFGEAFFSTASACADESGKPCVPVRPPPPRP